MPLADLAHRGAYIGYLRMNWACAAIEMALEQAGVRRVLPDWDWRLRRFDLAADLDAVGVALPPVQAHRVAPETGTILGWAYVLEGSRLGAKLVLRSVERSADQDVRAATRFLRHGVDGNLWASFKMVLARIDGDEGAIAQACDGARAGFQAFIDASGRA